jgi:hypothetical protein
MRPKVFPPNTDKGYITPTEDNMIHVNRTQRTVTVTDPRLTSAIVHEIDTSGEVLTSTDAGDVSSVEDACTAVRIIKGEIFKKYEALRRLDADIAALQDRRYVLEQEILMCEVAAGVEG